MSALFLISSILLVAAAHEPASRKRPQVFLQQHHLNIEAPAAASNPSQRVWMLCKQPPQQQRTPEEKAAGMSVLEPAKCTDEMPFENLCCARWKDEDFKNTGFMKLPIAAKKAGGGDVIKVCTQASNGMALMSKAHTAVAEMPVECFNDITAEQLKGESDGLSPGEIVLRERLLYFASSQIPLSSVPQCSKDVSSCPDGKSPVTVQSTWLAEQENRLKKGLPLGGPVADPSAAGNNVTSPSVNFHGWGFGGLTTWGSFALVMPRF